MGRKSNKKIQEIHPYRSKVVPLVGQRYLDIMPQARLVFRSVEKKTKRRPYVRSSYFDKDKIFFDYFWSHMHQKSLPDQARRLKYLPCALELIQKSQQAPSTFIDTTQPSIIRHRFLGLAPDGKRFVVQIKEDRKSGKKQFLSLFPED